MLFLAAFHGFGEGECILGKQHRMRRQMRQGTLMIAFIVVILCVSICVKTRSLKAQVKENNEKIDLLNSQIATEQERARDLSEQEQYRSTKAYVEEIAHEKLGLVYPDEIFIKAEDE